MMNSSRGRAVSPITGGTQNRRYCSWLARIVRHCSVTGADGGGAVLNVQAAYKHCNCALTVVYRCRFVGCRA
mgnify:CR=1 FL=1